MKIFTIILTGLLIASNINAQKDNIWLLKYDSTDFESCGYVDVNNNIRIPFGKYSMCFTDTFKTYAIVLKDTEGFIGIDKNENKLFTVYPYDNGPDYVKEGTFRIIENSKIGFADTTGKIIVQPVYDFAFGFEDGLALVNIGGHREKSDPEDPDCEYYTWTGGLWGVINREGKPVLDIRYNYRWNSETNKQELSSQAENYEFTKGELIQIDK